MVLSTVVSKLWLEIPNEVEVKASLKRLKEGKRVKLRLRGGGVGTRSADKTRTTVWKLP